MSWSSRIRHPAGTPPLAEVQSAVRNLAGQAGIAPGKMRIVFQTVSDVALLGTVFISGTLAAVHLYKALFPRHKEDHPTPEPAGGNRSPPRRRNPLAPASADGRGPDAEDGAPSR